MANSTADSVKVAGRQQQRRTTAVADAEELDELDISYEESHLATPDSALLREISAGCKKSSCHVQIASGNHVLFLQVHLVSFTNERLSARDA